MMKFLRMIVLMAAIVSCSTDKKEGPIEVTPEQFHRTVDRVVEIMVHDIFSPPVASRIFAYPNIAAYQIIALQNDNYFSLDGQVHELTPIPEPMTSKPINYQVAALVAHMELSKRLIFSEDRMEAYRDSLYGVWETKNATVFNISKDYGLAVADHIGKWMGKNNYAQTRTMPKFMINADDPTRWQPTPP